MKLRLTIITIAMAGAALIQPAFAEPVSNPWFTVDGGGGVSHGGAYSLGGTLGQWDATSVLTGSAFTLEPGFWSGLTTGQSGAPVLKIRFIGNHQAIVSWPLWVSGFRLEELTQLDTKQWVPTSEPIVDTGGEHTVTVAAMGVFKCYRLKK